VTRQPLHDAGLLGAIDAEPATALPRSNGELVFAEPWESRAFGMAAALADQGVFSWREFQHGLIAEIAAHADDSEPSHYYDRWLATLERLLAERGVVAPTELDALAEAHAKRPPGHDHGHDHGHGNDHPR
jgi:nitrile hydratase accessory protein